MKIKKQSHAETLKDTNTSCFRGAMLHVAVVHVGYVLVGLENKLSFVAAQQTCPSHALASSSVFSVPQRQFLSSALLAASLDLAA